MSCLVFIRGCGEMVVSTWPEMTAAIDRATALPPDQPLPAEPALAALAAGLTPDPDPLP